MSTNKLISRDGTAIHYLKTGSGPGLILIHGVLSQAKNYHALAESLGKNFTVYTIERRGRGLSGPQGEDYSLEKECEDIEALQQFSGAAYLFGHSYGGLIALEEGKRNNIFQKIAVYEPAVSVNKSISIEWIPAYKKYLAEKKFLDAFAVFSISTGPVNAQKMPLWLMKMVLPLFIKKEHRKQKYQLLQENLLEHIEVAKRNNSYTEYRWVAMPVLLLFGGKTNLGWTKQARDVLIENLPDAKEKLFPKLNHFGPDETGPAEVAEALTTFYNSKKDIMRNPVFSHEG